MKYAIWNNKGGVGKTFLTFILGSEYAHIHPDEDVLLVDMCPQANLSEIILGGNGNGSKELDKVLKENNRLTVGGYFDSRVSSPHNMTGDETSYLLRSVDYNKQLPENLWLICGDPSLEIQSQVINQIGTQTLPINAWKNVHSWLKELIQACSNKLTKGRNTKITVFIDCNPSFSAYTELVMATAERLIIPCTSDGSSARAIDNVAALLFGVGTNKQYESVNYSTKAYSFGIALPLIYSVILNRSTTWNERANKAFQAMFDEIKRRVKNHQEKQVFDRKLCFNEIPDTHSVTIVCSHYGMPLYHLKPGSYPVHDKNPQVNKEPLERYRRKVKTLVNIL
jgi:cellulose biosynthesis protein BcsQ